MPATRRSSRRRQEEEEEEVEQLQVGDYDSDGKEICEGDYIVEEKQIPYGKQGRFHTLYFLKFVGYPLEEGEWLRARDIADDLLEDWEERKRAPEEQKAVETDAEFDEEKMDEELEALLDEGESEDVEMTDGKHTDAAEKEVDKENAADGAMAEDHDYDSEEDAEHEVVTYAEWLKY